MKCRVKGHHVTKKLHNLMLAWECGTVLRAAAKQYTFVSVYACVHVRECARMHVCENYMSWYISACPNEMSECMLRINHIYQ